MRSASLSPILSRISASFNCLLSPIVPSDLSIYPLLAYSPLTTFYINNKIIYIKLIQIELILLLRHIVLHFLPLLLLLHLLPQLLHIFRLVNRRLPLLKNTTNHPIRILLGVNFRLLELAIVVLHHLLIEHLPHLGLYSISLHLLVPHPLIVNLHLLVHCLAYETPLELHVFESLLTLQLLVVLEDLLVLAELLVWVDSLVEKLILVVKVPNLLLPLC